MASATLVASGGLHDHAGVAGKIPVSGDACRAPDTEMRRGALHRSYHHLDRLKSDVVGVFQHCNDAGAVKGHIEFARQPVERSLVEDVEVPFARVGAGVDQFLRVDAGGRRAGDVADIVGARAARTQAEVLNLSSSATAFSLDSRICRWAASDGEEAAQATARSARPDNCQCLRMPSACEGGTCRNSAPARRRTARSISSGRCRRASGTRSCPPAP